MIRDIFRRIWEYLAVYSGVWVSCFIGMLALPFLTGYIPIVHFTEEEIVIVAQHKTISVNAVYYYRNPFPFPVSQGYILPFPEDEDHTPPTRIELIQCLPEKKIIPVIYSLGKYRFSLYFPARAKVEVHLSYDQTTPRGRGTYILTSTKPWGRPLEKAVYRLIPEGVQITGSNYPLTLYDSWTYLWTREQFMPPADWRFTWKEEKT